MPAPLDVDSLSRLVPAPSADAASATRAHLASLATPVGSLGRLEDLAAWVSAVQDATPPHDFRRVRVVVFAADHGIAAAGVSAYPPAATAALARLVTTGSAPVDVLARATGATVRLIDVGTAAEPTTDPPPAATTADRPQDRPPSNPPPDPADSTPPGNATADPAAADTPGNAAATPITGNRPQDATTAPAPGHATATVGDRPQDLPAGDPLGAGVFWVRAGSGRIDREDALTLAEAERAFAAGVAVADQEVDGGADLLIPGDLGVGSTTVAAVIVAAMTDTEPVHVIGRGSGIDDATWMRKITAIRDALRRSRPFASDPIALLAVAGGTDLAAITGLLVQAAVRRTPVLLDGVSSAAAALLAQHIAPTAREWWLAASLSPEPAHRLALERLELHPVLDLGLRAGQATGALTALPLLRAAILATTEISQAKPAGL